LYRLRCQVSPVRASFIITDNAPHIERRRLRKCKL